MKTESNLKPQLQFEIEAFPKKEGEPCLVILYDNVAGPFEKQMGDENTQTYYTYDRYELETPYAENLEERISASFDYDTAGFLLYKYNCPLLFRSLRSHTR